MTILTTLKRLFTILLSLLLLIATTDAFAQTVLVSGKVTDESGEPLTGASVLVKGTKIGVMTDSEGKYSISVPNPSSRLEFYFLGFESHIEDVGKRSRINVILSPDLQSLDEVVLIGYGTAKKSDLTGSVSGIRADDLNKTNMTSFEQALQGRLAGVVVMETSGAPGGGISIQVRGSNSMLGGTEPLYILDGVPMTADNASFAGREGDTGAGGNETNDGTNILSMMDPNDIASIEVLKDASATAIYGSRGANGVILITTKQGSAGKGKVSFNYSVNVGFPRKKLDVLDAKQFAAYVNEASWNDALINGETDTYTPKFVSPEFLEVYQNSEVALFPTNTGVDWQDEIFRAAVSHNASLNISGGTQKTRYAVMMGILDQQGIIDYTGYKRFSTRANITSEVKKWLSITSNTSLSRGYNKMTSTDTHRGQNSAGVVRKATQISPVVPVDASEDALIGGEYDPSEFMNPIKELKYKNDMKVENRVLTSLNLDFKITRHLIFRILGSANYHNMNRREFHPIETFKGMTANRMLANSKADALNLVNENTLNYNNSRGKHNLDAVAGFSVEKSSLDVEFKQATNFSSDLKPSFDKGDRASFIISESNTQTSLLSVLGRINYNYDHRYYATVSFRTDGSSKFSDKNKFAYFPSAALTWRLSEEKFFQNVKPVMNLFKLRYSYGTTGNQAIPPYRTLAGVSAYSGVMNGQIFTGFGDSRLAAPDLKWETTYQRNVGVDYGFFNDRISGSINYYYKKTVDLLQNITIPTSTGFSNQIQNNGIISNLGFEFEINAAPVMKKNVQWTLAGNLAVNQNKILSLGKDIDQQYGGLPFVIQKVGYPIGTFWGYKTEGIIQNEKEAAAMPDVSGVGGVLAQPGEYKFCDISGADGVPDGIVNEYDKTYLGDANPDFTFGFNTSLTVYNFNLYCQFSGVMGNSVYNRMIPEIDGVHNITVEVYKNLWRGEGSSNSYPKAAKVNASGRLYDNFYADIFVEDASYVRLKTLRLSYNIPITQKFRRAIQQLGFYIAGDNLMTLTKYRGFDPEVSSFGQNPGLRGIDFGSYPKAISFTAGLNLIF